MKISLFIIAIAVQISCSNPTEPKNDLQKLHDISGKVTQILQKDYSYNENGIKELWFDKIYDFNKLGNTILYTWIWRIGDKAAYVTNYVYDTKNRIVKEITTKNNKKYGEINYTYNKNIIYSTEILNDTLYEKRTRVIDKNGNITFEQKFVAPFGDYLHKSKFSYNKNDVKIKEIKHYAVINKNYATCCEEFVDTLNFVYDKNNFLISDGYKNPTLFKYSNLDENKNWTIKRTYFSNDSKTPTVAIERKIIYEK